MAIARARDDCCCAVVPAYALIGASGRFRLPVGRAIYEAVLFDFARLAGSGGLMRQIDRYVDWDQPI